MGEETGVHSFQLSHSPGRALLSEDHKLAVTYGLAPGAIGNADLAVLATCVRDLPVPRVGKVVLFAFPVMLEKNEVLNVG